MLRALAVSLLLLEATAGEAAPGQCAPSTYQNQTCFNTPKSIAKQKNTDSATACCALCAENPLCFSFTMNYKKGNLCFLHPNVGPSPPTKNGNCSSGVVRTGPLAPTPAPAPPPSPGAPTPGPSPAPKGAKNVLFLVSGRVSISDPHKFRSLLGSHVRSLMTSGHS